MTLQHLTTAIVIGGFGVDLPAQQGSPPPFQEAVPPPSQLQAVEGLSVSTIMVVWQDTANGGDVSAAISLDTLGQKISITWFARPHDQIDGTMDVTAKNVSFFPTAMTRSQLDWRVFYIAGKKLFSTKPVLERWMIGAPTVSELNGEVQFEAPEITRQSLEIDQSIQNISDISANAWMEEPPSESESIWVFEYESRDVYSIDPEAGTKTLQVDASQVSDYRAMETRLHTLYGAVTLYFRKPFWVHESLWTQDLANDPDFFAVYDTNRDGVLDGSFTIGWDIWSNHTLYTTGEFVQIHPQ